MWKWLKFGAAILVASIAALNPMPASAQVYGPGEIEISTPTPVAGEPVTVQVSGFAPNSVVEVFFRSAPILIGTFTADANGVVEATVAIPSDASGQHTIEVVGVDSNGDELVGSIPVQVAPTSGGDESPLPASSSSLSTAVILGASAAAVGVALFSLVAWRRRTTV